MIYGQHGLEFHDFKNDFYNTCEYMYNNNDILFLHLHILHLAGDL